MEVDGTALPRDEDNLRHAIRPSACSIHLSESPALIDGESATVKRLFHEAAHHLRLQPAHAEMASLRLPAEAVQLIGVVTAVLREVAGPSRLAP